MWLACERSYYSLSKFIFPVDNFSKRYGKSYMLAHCPFRAFLYKMTCWHQILIANPCEGLHSKHGFSIRSLQFRLRAILTVHTNAVSIDNEWPDPHANLSNQSTRAPLISIIAANVTSVHTDAEKSNIDKVPKTSHRCLG